MFSRNDNIFKNLGLEDGQIVLQYPSATSGNEEKRLHDLGPIFAAARARTGVCLRKIAIGRRDCWKRWSWWRNEIARIDDVEFFYSSLK